MYCTRCGKQIDYDSLICKECQQELLKASVERETSSIEQPRTYSTVKPRLTGKVTDGIGNGIGSIIFGVVAVYLSYLAIVVAAIAVAESYVNEFNAFAFLSLFINFIAFCAEAVSVAFGVKAIKMFIDAKKQNRVKPVPTLVLGIVGISAIEVTLVFSFIAFFIVVLI